MNKNLLSKSSTILLEGIEGYYNKIFRLLKWLCIVFVSLIFIFLVWMNIHYVKSGNTDTIGYLIFSYIFFLSIVGIFSIAFISLKKQRKKSKRKFQYFIDIPDSLVSYQIMTGEVIKLTLTGTNRKATFPIELSPLQIEDAIFDVFPHLRKDKKVREVKKIIVNTTPSVDKYQLMEEVPPTLKHFFEKKFKQKLGCLPFIFGIFLTIAALSLIGRLGWYNFWIFDTENMYWGYVLMPMLLFGFMVFYAKSDDKKTRELLKNPENIIWIYLERTKNRTLGIPTADTINLVIADVKKKYTIALFEREDETLHWLSLYCPTATVGFYYEWDKIYNENPTEFLNLTKNKRPHEES